MQNEHTIVTAIIELPRFYFMEQRKKRMKHNYCQKFSFNSKILPLDLPYLTQLRFRIAANQDK